MFCLQSWIPILFFLTYATPIYLILFVSASYFLNRPCVYCSLLLLVLIFVIFDFQTNWFESPSFSLDFYNSTLSPSYTSTPFPASSMSTTKSQSTPFPSLQSEVYPSTTFYENRSKISSTVQNSSFYATMGLLSHSILSSLHTLGRNTSLTSTWENRIHSLSGNFPFNSKLYGLTQRLIRFISFQANSSVVSSSPSTSSMTHVNSESVDALSSTSASTFSNSLPSSSVSGKIFMDGTTSQVTLDDARKSYIPTFSWHIPCLDVIIRL